MIWTTGKTLCKTQKRPRNPYFAQAYDFMEKWLGGAREFVLHTSGSTGMPKPITVTRAQLAASAAMTGKALSLGPGTRALVCLNVGYIAGLMMLVRGMELDWELTVTEPTANPLAGLDHADFDFVAMVPMQLQSILENSATSGQVDRLGKVLLGGAPVNHALAMQISDLAMPVYQSYGMTETVSHVALKALNGPEASELYVFLPGIQYGVDERGCLHISGAVTNGQTVQTNDLVEIHGNAFQWIGRADNVINSGGVKIVLDQIDQRIAAVFHHLNIGNAFFCWWEPDAKLGQKLVLVIENAMPEALTERLTAEIRSRVSTYENPKHIYFAKAFAKTQTDKIDKRATFQKLSDSSNG
ncbi:AMP-binding protein [Dyadobacter fermentans]|uniref:Acyl-CoA synthetase (AMP-forming)/AMP-acid ligase II-like protein n=2 Tax=Dyadobacter fermentans (strain ATCC 700827 / DSM 18053 / CIP 107007 / KCTC 52180 / NS114) TaxID=471854 RepID=C6W5A4_DYAFD|nr:AMP-binding protein [Dyadobacter fermentans]ACT92464.1 acyl-CoA synthetase (AMP-forming)/AMP-acid ligase II-like protein [Dyadobacter fermentans DSM 18053]